MGSSFCARSSSATPSLVLPALQQRQAVVDVFARRIGRQVQRLFELIDGLRLRGGVFVKCFTEIAVAPYAVLLDARRFGPEQQHQRRNRQNDNTYPGGNSLHP